MKKFFAIVAVLVSNIVMINVANWIVANPVTQIVLRNSENMSAYFTSMNLVVYIAEFILFVYFVVTVVWSVLIAKA